MAFYYNKEDDILMEKLDNFLNVLYNVNTKLERIADGLENFNMFKEASAVDVVALQLKKTAQESPSQLFKEIAEYSRVGEGYSNKEGLSKAIDDFVNSPDLAGELLYILPELKDIFFDGDKPIEHDSPYHKENIWEHVVGVVRSSNVTGVSNLRDKVIMLLATMFHDIGKPATKKFTERAGTGLTFDGKEGLYQYINHAEVGADMIDGVLQKLGIAGTIADTVKKMVRMHLRFHDAVSNYKKSGGVSKGFEKLLRDFDDPSEAARLMGMLAKADSLGAQHDDEGIQNMAKGMKLQLRHGDYDYGVGEEMWQAHRQSIEDRSKSRGVVAAKPINKELVRKFLVDDLKVDFDMVGKIVGMDVTTKKELIDKLREVSRQDLIEPLVKGGII